MFLRLLLVLALLAGANTALAQDAETRAAQADRERSEKAAHLEPYQPSKAEAVLYTVENRYLAERLLNPPRGVFARVGGMPEGQGFKLGPGYRYSNYNMSFTTTGVVSVRRAWELDARLVLPGPAATFAPGFFSVGGVMHSMPQEDFYGFGEDTIRAAKTSYLLDESAVDVTGGVRPRPWLLLSGTGEYRTERPGAGRDGKVPPVESVYTSDEVPGLNDDVDYVRIGGVAAMDLTSAPQAILIGGRYALAYSKYFDQSGHALSFNQFDVDLQQFVPIFTSARLIALRAHASSVSPADGNDVPFYMQPTLGGSHSLRAYPVQRFRDRNSLLVQAEYRFELNAFMTGSLFYDTGTVAFKAADLNLNNASNDWGFGLRFGFGPLTGMRAEIVFGGDAGTVYVLRFGDVF